MTLFAEVSFSAALVSDRKAKVDREGTAFMLFSAAKPMIRLWTCPLVELTMLPARDIRADELAAAWMEIFAGVIVAALTVSLKDRVRTLVFRSRVKEITRGLLVSGMNPIACTGCEAKSGLPLSSATMGCGTMYVVCLEVHRSGMALILFRSLLAMYTDITVGETGVYCPPCRAYILILPLLSASTTMATLKVDELTASLKVSINTPVFRSKVKLAKVGCTMSGRYCETGRALEDRIGTKPRLKPSTTVIDVAVRYVVSLLSAIDFPAFRLFRSESKSFTTSICNDCEGSSEPPESFRKVLAPTLDCREMAVATNVDATTYSEKRSERVPLPRAKVKAWRDGGVVSGTK